MFLARSHKGVFLKDKEKIHIQDCAIDGSTSSKALFVAEESPVEIRYNGIYYAIMMLSPIDLEDFAIGFSLTEGIIHKVEDVKSVTVQNLEDGFCLNIGVYSQNLRIVLSRQKRNIAGASGCGICGGDRAVFAINAPQVASVKPKMKAVFRALEHIKACQIRNKDVHFLHASAWCTLDGEIEIVREDVGRHNSLDKLIGCLYRHRREKMSGFCLITSRCSYEMVKKALYGHMGCLVALSGVSSRAYHMAKQAGLTLFFKVHGKKIFLNRSDAEKSSLRLKKE